MKITIQKNKKSMSVTFRADKDGEGEDLKDVLLKCSGDFQPIPVIEELGELGYQESAPPAITKTKTTFVLRKGATP